MPFVEVIFSGGVERVTSLPHARTSGTFLESAAPTRATIEEALFAWNGFGMTGLLNPKIVGNSPFFFRVIFGYTSVYLDHEIFHAVTVSFFSQAPHFGRS